MNSMAYRNTMASTIRCQGVGYAKIHSVTDQASINPAKLVAFRAAKGWSIKRLVREAGVDYSSYWRLEKGQALNPRIETIQRVARALGVVVEELILRPGEAAMPPALVRTPGAVRGIVSADEAAPTPGPEASLLAEVALPLLAGEMTGEELAYLRDFARRVRARRAASSGGADVAGGGDPARGGDAR